MPACRNRFRRPGLSRSLMTSSRPESLKVLVVDDDAQMLRTITDILRAHGYATSGAPTGVEALRMAGLPETTPPTALLDLRLPDHHGNDLLCPRLPDIKNNPQYHLLLRRSVALRR